MMTYDLPLIALSDAEKVRAEIANALAKFPTWPTDPLHALAVGYFATMTLAMASRVTLGHSGRPLVADRLTWLLALGLHAVATVRVLADLLPVGQPVLLALAGLGWLAVFIPWAVRLVPLYLTRRADGKPG